MAGDIVKNPSEPHFATLTASDREALIATVRKSVDAILKQLTVGNDLVMPMVQYIAVARR